MALDIDNIINSIHYCSTVSKDELQIPPKGPFTYSDLVWSSKPGTQAHLAYIPKNRVTDYIQGEQDRCSCSFTTSHVVNNETPKVNRKNALLYAVDFNCCYGPKDDRSKADITIRRKRRSKIAMGEGIKVGCQARFRAAVYALKPDVVELRVYQVSILFKKTLSLD
jgi:hypothetical protein